jgi:hypothetical protein
LGPTPLGLTVSRSLLASAQEVIEWNGEISSHSLEPRRSAAVGTVRALVGRYGLKNVPTPFEIIAELLACHAGAVTKSDALGTPSWLRRWSPRSVLSRIERSATTSLLKRPADMVATMCRGDAMIGQTIVIDAGRYFHWQSERPSRMDLSGKTAIVTGAASGIALGVATCL